MQSATVLGRSGSGAVNPESSQPSSHQNSYSALVETLLFLSVMVLLNEMFGDGHRFIGMEMHPFWIIVLLVTVQYGAKEALVTSLLASFFLLAGNMPEQNLTETMYGYTLRVTFLPFLWIVTSLILGSIRSRQIFEKERLMHRIASSEEAKEAIAKSYKALKQMKERLELRLAEERRSVLSVYNIAKSLETLDPADAELEVCKLMKMAFNASQFSFYRYDGDGLSLEAAHGWETPGSYNCKFDGDTRLVRTILEDKRILSIVNEEDERLLDGQGVLAGPILDVKTGKIYGMLKIEEIGFMDMGIRTHETFRIVCEWIGRVYANIDKYQSIQGSFGDNTRTKSVYREHVTSPQAHLMQPITYTYPASKAAA